MRALQRVRDGKREKREWQRKERQGCVCVCVCVRVCVCGRVALDEELMVVVVAGGWKRQVLRMKMQISRAE